MVSDRGKVSGSHGQVANRLPYLCHNFRKGQGKFHQPPRPDKARNPMSAGESG
jgi:hypothetical protein